MKLNLVIMLAVLSLFVVSCSTGPNYTNKTLPSGRVIKVAGVGQISFSKDDPALMLKYYTDVDLKDKAALQKEIDEVWLEFLVDVERAGLKSAIISANELPKGIVSKTVGDNFIFEKQPDGKWAQKK